MVFSDELLNKLAKDGISFIREKDGSLTYTANYQYVVAFVFPFANQFTIEAQVCDPGEAGRIDRWGFNEKDDDPEQLLRDIAESAGNLDQSFNDMFENLVNYV